MERRTPAEKEVPELLIERLALGELSEGEAAALRARIAAAGGPSEAERLAAIEASNEAILAAHPPARAAAVIERRLAERRQRARAAWWMAAPALVAAAAVVLVVRTQGDGMSEGPGSTTASAADTAGDPDTAGGPDTVRLKGLEPHLEIYRKAGDAAERLADRAAVRAGDVLQVSYVAAGAAHGVIVSIDGNGVVTIHLPPPGGPADAPLLQGGAIPLSAAYELDDAPGFERFFFVTGPSAEALAGVEAAAQALARRDDHGLRGSLELGPELRQSAITLVKASAEGG